MDVDKVASMDGPLETCSSVRRNVGPDTITFETKAGPATARARWVWARSGFSQPDAIAYQRYMSLGWDDFRSRYAAHPSDLMRNAEVGA